jgi:hypothetical protein
MQPIGVGIWLITLTATGINVYVGLRLAATNGKYVTAALVAEMHANFGHEMQQIDKRLERIEERCAERFVCALQQKQ